MNILTNKAIKMKKTIILGSSMLLLFACSDNKEKNKTTGTSQEHTGHGSTEISGEDKAIKEWLVGKEWKAENDGAPFAILKVFSLDTCGFTTGRYSWDFKNGRFIMLAEWPLTKVNDSTFTIYVTPTEKTYTYNLTGKL